MSTSMALRLGLALLAVALVAPAQGAAGAAPFGGIGFCYDGTGVFPADCKPPTEFDGNSGRNLVWKVPLPNYSSSSPVVVGGKVFVTCAAGWPGGQDCAQLLCYDAETGKELWRHDLDEFATMPPEQAKEAREVRSEYHRRTRKINLLRYELKTADEKCRAALSDPGGAADVPVKTAVEGAKAAIRDPAAGPTHS